MQTQDSRGLGLKRHSSMYFQNLFQSHNGMRKMKEALMTNVESLNEDNKISKPSRWLFNLKIKHQVLVLTTILILFVTSMFMGINHVQMAIFTSLLSNGFNQMLHQSNANFQASVLIKYMTLTQNYFSNDQQMLLAINQIYGYCLKSKYSINLGVECALPSKKGKYPSYYKLDLFCYAPQTTNDLQTFENSTLNTEFVKFTNVLNQFILCFGFQQQFQKNNIIQINLDNQDQLGSYYPQSSPLQGYFPKQRPFFIFQKQQYEQNVTREFYISDYQKFYKSSGTPVYGQTLTLSLLNKTQFQGVIAISIQFGVFNYFLQNFPDVNLALVALDGTLLFEQNQIQKYDRQQFIYNQSSTGYTYLDWLKLQAHQDSVQQIVMNNTLFSEPIKVNIKKFKQLPYYFIVYNNLTYENQIKTIQVEILNKVDIQYQNALLVFFIAFLVLLIAVCCSIEFILKPLTIIQKIIYSHNENFKKFQQLREPKQSNNILYILELMIYLKYSELQNLSFKKSLQCQQIEDLQYSIKLNKNKEVVLVRYLTQNQLLIKNYSQNISDYELESNYTESQFVGESGYKFTLQ